MSETVQYKGKLKIVPKLYKDESMDEQCKRIVNKLIEQGEKIDMDSYENDYVEALFESCYDKYVLVGNDVYEIIEKYDLGFDESVFSATNNSDGTINFHVMYYNGGCCLSEAIGYAIENMEDNTQENDHFEKDENILYNADPNCEHKIVTVPSGGIKCTRCNGWFAY